MNSNLKKLLLVGGVLAALYALGRLIVGFLKNSGRSEFRDIWEEGHKYLSQAGINGESILPIFLRPTGASLPSSGSDLDPIATQLLSAVKEHPKDRQRASFCKDCSAKLISTTLTDVDAGGVFDGSDPTSPVLPEVEVPLLSDDPVSKVVQEEHGYKGYIILAGLAAIIGVILLNKEKLPSVISGFNWLVDKVKGIFFEDDFFDKLLMSRKPLETTAAKERGVYKEFKELSKINLLSDMLGIKGSYAGRSKLEIFLRLIKEVDLSYLQELEDLRFLNRPVKW